MTSTVVGKSCKKASPSSCWLSSLPDEMVINCFARVSRVDLMSLSMVSKRCRSLVLSPDLYNTRSQLGFKEECVYVFFESTRGESKPFILRRVKEKPFKNRLIPIPSFPTQRYSSIVAFGEGIYVIGGFIESTKIRFVSFLDCRTHTWSYLPSMRIARARAEVGVLDGKIYVIGGCDMNVNDLSNWVEVFDPKMQTWSGVNIQDPKTNLTFWYMNIQDPETELGFCNIYDFEAEEDKWNDLNKKGYCDKERLLYSCDHKGEITWCEPWSEVKSQRMIWRKVYGLESLQKSFCLSSGLVCSEEMADVWHCYMLKLGHLYGLSLQGSKPSTISGGNIVLFWNKIVGKASKSYYQIWCTEISMEKREGGDIWGTVQWSNHVYTIDPFPYSLTTSLHSVSVNV